MKIFGCLLMMYLMFMYPDIAADASRRALQIFGQDIFPVLFPYMVLTRILIAKVRTPSLGTVIPFCLLGGSPTSASILDAYMSHYSTNKKTLLALCALTGTISPAFQINTVGSWIKDPRITSFLVISHFGGSAAASILVYLSMKDDDSIIMIRPLSASNHDTNAISSSIMPILGVGGCLVFFSVLSEAINTVLIHEPSIGASLIHAILEISGGVKKLSEGLPNTASMRYTLIAFSCGFSSLSILSQNAMFLKDHSITISQLVGIGLIRGFASSSIMQILMPFYDN